MLLHVRTPIFRIDPALSVSLSLLPFLLLAEFLILFKNIQDFPGGSVVMNTSANTGQKGFEPSREDSTCHRAMKSMCHNH